MTHKTIITFLFKTIIFCSVINDYISCTADTGSDKPCASRSVNGESVICVCHETYCDEVTRTVPEQGSYIAYTSTKKGQRFHKSTGKIDSILNVPANCCPVHLEIDPNIRFQTIKGFGGAVTDAAGINWRKLTDGLQKHLIDKSGLEYNMIRVPIGGSDFSTHAYAYNELPVDDVKLTNFSLSPEDHLYKIPMIKAAMETATVPIHVIASTWSPPVWMKNNNAFSGVSRLKDEYFQTYADYHLRFLEKYANERVPIWAITTTNEPINGIGTIAKFNSLGWTPLNLGKWIINNLGPTIRNSAYNSTQILALDGERYIIPIYIDDMVADNSSVLQYIDGLAVHFYANLYTPATILSSFIKKYPSKYIIATEACEGSFNWQFSKVALGSWGRAQSYIKNIITDLNHSVSGWLDWNLCLDMNGGPSWSKNYVDAPILIKNENMFLKQPMYYAMGHFSKFIPRGSQRISIVNKTVYKFVERIAFITPDDTIVVVIYNRGSAKLVRLLIGENVIKFQMDENAVTTLEIKL